MRRTGEYKSYLKSKAWDAMRQRALRKARNRCQVCCSTKDLDVHHRTYERFGDEDLADLTVLCRDCHDVFHEHGRWQRNRQAESVKRFVPLLGVMACASRFYRSCLKELDDDHPALGFVGKEMGRPGYACGGQRLRRHCLSRGYDDATLMEAGLIFETETMDEPADLYSHCVVWHGDEVNAVPRFFRAYLITPGAEGMVPPVETVLHVADHETLSAAWSVAAAEGLLQ